MKCNHPLSLRAYRIAAVILFIQILVLAFRFYVSKAYPPIDDASNAELMYGHFELNIASSYATLVCLFAKLYPFLIICLHNYYTSPTASIIAFLWVFFSFIVEVCLLSVSLFEMQIKLPAVLMTTNGPNVTENALAAFHKFRELQRFMDFPVSFSKIAFSIIILSSINLRPTIDFFIKAAFFINTCYYIVHFCCLFKGLRWVEDYNRTLSLPIEMIVLGLVLIWMIRPPVVKVVSVCCTDFFI